MGGLVLSRSSMARVKVQFSGKGFSVEPQDDSLLIVARICSSKSTLGRTATVSPSSVVLDMGVK